MSRAVLEPEAALSKSAAGGVRIHMRGAWERWGKSLLVFALLMIGYMLSFSFDENDALDTAYWMEGGDIRSLLEFRHLVQRMLPLWLWKGLLAIHVDISALALLNLWDFATGALSVMLLYCVLKEITQSRPLSFGGAFGYATAHCVWVYTGSGRLYSTSMLLVFAAYYLALQMGKLRTERARRVVAFAAGTYVCFAGLFWLVHVFSAISVGLLLVLLPVGVSGLRRAGYLTLFGATGAVLALVIAVSCLTYVQIPLEQGAVKSWMLAAGTQPMVFDRLSPMKASFGQSHGILVTYELPYMINAAMFHDPALKGLGSLPWQLGKFLLVWLLMILVYLYPLLMLRRTSPSLRMLILVLYIPLAINMYFALGWLGSDVQRFMPSMLSQFALACISVRYLMKNMARPRLLAAALIACLAFIAADNLVESLLPSQTNHMVLAEAMKGARYYTRPGDVMMNFGRDLPISYQTMTRFYGGARALTTTNDVTKYNWDSGSWKEHLDKLLRRVEAGGGRLFLMDRLALGLNPVQAAWTERQHPRPAVKQFAEHVRGTYCVTPTFYAGNTPYYRMTTRTAACPADALTPTLEKRP